MVVLLSMYIVRSRYVPYKSAICPPIACRLPPAAFHRRDDNLIDTIGTVEKETRLMSERDICRPYSTMLNNNNHKVTCAWPKLNFSSHDPPAPDLVNASASRRVTNTRYDRRLWVICRSISDASDRYSRNLPRRGPSKCVCVVREGSLVA